MIGYHLLLGRKHGSAVGYPILISFDDPSAVLRKYEELTTSPGVADFGAENAELLFVSDGIALHNHDFPDPAEVERQRRKRVLADARRIAADNEAAQARLRAAKDSAAQANAAMKELSPEQKALLAEEASERAKAEAEAKERAEAERLRLEAEAAERAQAAAAAKARQDAQAARDTFIAELSSQGDDQLHKLAADNKTDLPLDATRDQVIAAIADAAGLTVPAE